VAPAGRGGRNDALDGLRLVAVAAVMAFHFGLPHAAGGFLGVDLFFVLSGYLITSLLLGQVVDGRVDLPGFWARRLRRLIPGLLALMVVVVAWGALAAPSVLRDHLRGDITATLFYVANWHFVSASSYFASDGTQSPLEHMWSLAVEEQFYLVWPILLALVAVAARQPRGRRIAVAVLAGTGFAVSLARLATLWSASGSDRAYFGTDSRIFEPLAGALLALLVTSPRPRAALVRSHWLLLALGAVGLGWGFATLGRTTGVRRRPTRTAAHSSSHSPRRLSSQRRRLATAGRHESWPCPPSPTWVASRTRCTSGTGRFKCGRSVAAGGT